ncbi:MAG: MBL fold metallo-hydrolase [Chloroflexi bacterium]|nr:MBL fold metallo-hydrolase [Chloroflexota bacterium]
MARAEQSHLDSVDGPWFVDTRCIACDSARHWAPGLTGTDAEGRSFVIRQPVSRQEEAAMWRAAAACPTRSIGNRQQLREPQGIFPYQLTDGVYALGNNAMASFAAHSFLVTRSQGNLMIDSPRFSRPLAEEVDGLGGVAHVLLTHRDDVADAERWMNRYDARVWIDRAEAFAAPFATDVTSFKVNGNGAGNPGYEITEIAPGVTSIPAPGHTEGHVVYHVDNRHLFTGDTLHWNHRREELDVLQGQTFFGWHILADTMMRLAELPVEWVFPGHGMWHRVGFKEWPARMVELASAMSDLGQEGWSTRTGAAYYWF